MPNCSACKYSGCGARSAQPVLIPVLSHIKAHTGFLGARASAGLAEAGAVLPDNTSSPAKVKIDKQTIRRRIISNLKQQFLFVLI
jgi:hypothetical protein